MSARQASRATSQGVHMVEYEGYRIADPEAIETPAMVVFEARLDANIAALCELVGGGDNLMVHVKTHKSDAVTRKQVAAGIAGFKCATLQELGMVLAAGAAEAILAYPMVQAAKGRRFATIAAAHPGARVHATASAGRHVELLEQVSAERRQTLSVMLDLDVGMHRTGIAPGDEAANLYRRIAAAPHLQPGGLHVYDGHDHVQDPAARQAAAARHIEEVQQFKAGLEAAGLPVPRLVAGGSFSFPYYARTPGWHGSPGTCAYWDTGYAGAMPDMPFTYAALVLAQVVDRYPEQQTVTADLGYKAIAGDPPVERRISLLGYREARLLLQNEEHGVFAWAGELPEVGTYLLAVPGHVCPTTIRYSGSYVVNEAGEVVDFYPHTARDRQ
ncbi:MAG: alanine racemase [Gemmatimonadota bacterium]